MLDESTARDRLLAFLAWTSRPMVVTGCTLSARGTHFILDANTEAYVRTGDTSHALVGVGAYLVDRVTGVVEALGTGRDPEHVLQDRLDAEAAGPRAWVVRPTDPVDPVDIVRVRQWLGCSPTQARAVVRAGPWFHGPRRLVVDTVDALRALGLPVEAALVDGPDAAISLLGVGAEVEDLRDALRRTPP